MAVPLCNVGDLTASTRQRRPQAEVSSHAVLVAAVSALALALLPGCATRSLSRSDREQVCRIDVEVKCSQATFVPNPLSTGAGAVVGAGGGAIAGLFSPFPPAALLLAPLGVLVGGGYGASCAAASLKHPSANADFEQILGAADFGLLKRSLEVELKAPRAECARAVVDSSASSKPDAVVEVVQVEAEMACLLDNQKYSIAVQWRAVSAKTGITLAEARTQCWLSSFRGVDAWFADPAHAREEIERLLGKVGQRIALELFGQATSQRCSYLLREDGELEAL